MTAWIVVLAAGAGSYAMRLSMLVVAERYGLPPALEQAARFAVPTAFIALAAGSLASQATWSTEFAAPVCAIVVAAVAARRTGSSHMSLIAGLPTLWMVNAAVTL
jgi:branched-subunit amino acid transport protein